MFHTPCFFFQGTSETATTAYADLFGTGPLVMNRMSDGPPGMPVPPGRENRLTHAVLPVEGGQLYASDEIEDRTPAMEGSSVMIEFPTFDRAKAVFDARAKGGEVRMPFEAQFWTPGFGALTDAWGIRWMIGVQSPSQGD